MVARVKKSRTVNMTNEPVDRSPEIQAYLMPDPDRIARTTRAK